MDINFVAKKFVKLQKSLKKNLPKRLFLGFCFGGKPIFKLILFHSTKKKPISKREGFSKRQIN